MRSCIKYIILTALLFFADNSFAAPANYRFDKDHTTILFAINHLGYSDKIGLFRDYDGSFTLDEDNPENSAVEVVLKPAGIDTGSKALDAVLQGKDWFNTAKYPDITFKSMRVIVNKDDNTAVIKGWVTMLGVTKRAELTVKFNKAGKNMVTGTYNAGFTADLKIKRSLFGMIIDIPFVGDEVHVHIEAEGIRQ